MIYSLWKIMNKVSVVIISKNEEKNIRRTLESVKWADEIVLIDSQSEDNIYSTGFYNEKTKSTPLPHKTIAGLAGLGWIGKHNLLVTPEFGSAICMCTVLTDAPIEPVLHTPVNSQCGNCSICKDICSFKAIEGNTWNIRTSRDELVDVYKCNTCLRCLVFCPWTQIYMKKNIMK